MDVVLVGGRHGRAGVEDVAAATARELAAGGHAVRWIRPLPQPDLPAPELPDGVEPIPVTSALPPFRAVTARLADIPTERALSHAIRRRLPDVVHVLALGGGSSALTPWVAERLGAPSVVSMRAVDLLCHRGTLVNERAEACDEWDVPERCAECCAVAFEGGLTAAQARWARRLSFLGAWSPYPGPVDFLNRFEVLLGGLLAAGLVLAGSETEAELLARAGVPAGRLRVVPAPATAEALEEAYRASC